MDGEMVLSTLCGENKHCLGLLKSFFDAKHPKFNANSLIESENRLQKTTMLDIAIQEKNTDFIQLLFENNHNPNLTKYTSECAFLKLCYDCKKDNVAALNCLKYFIDICREKNVEINILASDETGSDVNALFIAVNHENLSLLKYLLSNVYFPNNNKINRTGITAINATDEMCGWTLLHLTAGNKGTPKSFEIFKLLVEYGCDLNACDAGKELPIHCCCEQDNLLILNYILNTKRYLYTIH